MEIKMYFFLFLIYSIMGWLIEVTLGIIENKKFVNRGFMVGPYCPIYGIGGILITIFLKGYTEYPIALFCIAIVVCGLLEYFTSYIMEKFFKARWWDYSRRKFNINGRVCLETIIPFGLLGCFITYISNPFFVSIFEKIPENVGSMLFYILFSVFIMDFIVSLFIISKMRKTVKEVNKHDTYDNTEEITKKVKDILTNKSPLHRRLVNAFPKISIEKVKLRIKETTEQVKENVAKATEEAAVLIKEGANKVKESTLKAKEDATEKLRNGANMVKETAKKTTEKFKKN